MAQWVDYDIDFVRRRYNRLAAFYSIFEWLWLPRGIRAATVERMALRPGARVLEVGCGTGRNIPALMEAIGASGHLFGVDLSDEMLTLAKELCARQGWQNVTLLLSDATAYCLPERMDAVLFSLSYCTMPHHQKVLRHAWEQLRPGGCIVVLDSKVPGGLAGRLLRPLMFWTSRATVLGNPDVHPWEELRALAGRIEFEERFGGTYFICRGCKPAPEPCGAGFGLSADASRGL
jgi:ubiquinone/menaquinone biosynthesis C-methylase UbiE